MEQALPLHRRHAGVGLIGAAVKLRQLLHPELGMGDRCSADVALARSALAAIEREIAAG